MSPERRDFYYYRAKQENLRSRAAFKLEEIQQKYSVLKERSNVMEIGSAPGGWSSLIRMYSSGLILSIDQTKMEPIEGVTFIRGDIERDEIYQHIGGYCDNNSINGFDCILSDAMVKTSGHGDTDHARSYLICKRVMTLAEKFLLPGGNVLMKQFQGDMTQAFIAEWRPRFAFSKAVKPSASRRGSRELYILFKGYAGT